MVTSVTRIFQTGVFIIFYRWGGDCILSISSGGYSVINPILNVNQRSEQNGPSNIDLETSMNGTYTKKWNQRKACMHHNQIF